MDLISKLGPGILVGIIAGIVLSAWVDPFTAAGKAVIVVGCAILFGAVGGVVAKIFGRRA
jgi:hypothetical protein